MWPRKFAGISLSMIFALSMILALSIFPAVHAPGNPVFVTFADNATCGAHCTFTQDGVQSFTNDQWGTWGLSPALVVTSGDLLVIELVNFCIFNSSGTGAPSRCDITAVADSLGNTWTCTTVGNNILEPGSSAPVVGMSVCYSLATVSGTEPATNAFTLTVNCGTCTTANPSHQYDSEWVVYEYANAQSVLRGTVVTTSTPVSTLNAPITTTTAGDAIYGFAYTDSANRPLLYQSSQTNQHSWAGSNGYFTGDLENLAAGPTDYKMGVTTASNNFFILISAEISNTLPPVAPSSPWASPPLSSLKFVIPLLVVGFTLMFIIGGNRAGVIGMASPSKLVRIVIVVGVTLAFVGVFALLMS